MSNFGYFWNEVLNIFTEASNLWFLIPALLVIIFLIVVVVMLSRKNKKDNKKNPNDENLTPEMEKLSQIESEDEQEEQQEQEEENEVQPTVEEQEQEEEQEEENEVQPTIEEQVEEKVQDTIETNVSKDNPPKFRVIYDKAQNNWIVKREGSARAIKRVSTKEEALVYAKIYNNQTSNNLNNGRFQKIKK